MRATSSSWVRTWAASGWAKIVRIAAATISAEALGTLASTLRMKCTRQRCQAAPMNTDCDRGLEAEVVVGDHQLHPGQAAGSQRPQERGPEGAVLGVADVDAEDLAVAGGGDTGGDHDRPGHDPTADAALDVGGVDEHVGELDMVERAGAERLEVVVELARRSVTPRDLEIPASSPRRLTRSSTLRVETPCT